MLLNKYEIFLKTAEIGNITRTAEVLHYTQAGISHAIASLEKETGFPLVGEGKSGLPGWGTGWWSVGQRLLLHAVRITLPDGRAFACAPHWPDPWTPATLPPPFPDSPPPNMAAITADMPPKRP